MSISTYNELKSEFTKFPIPDKPERYRKMVELATLLFLPLLLKELLQPYHKNIEVCCNYFPSKGTDITVYSNGKLLLKMEVLNWWIQSILNQKRAIGIKKNLKGAPFKILYVPSERNLTWSCNEVIPASRKILKGINIYYSGYQILPITYFNTFYNIDYRFTEERVVFNEKTFNHQKIRLRRFFKQIGLIPLVN